jgi:ABC-type transport system involved in cytochrome c biogenesis ATPase subunit
VTDLAVESRALSKSYDGLHAVDSIDLKVPRHSVFGFLGPNGAGKTTTMKMLLGLIQPTSGSGSVFDLDIVADSPKVRGRVGYLPQEPRFYPRMTARETLRFASGLFFSGPSEAVETRIGEMLDLVGLTGKADRPVKTLSGGETQRLGIAQRRSTSRICSSWTSRHRTRPAGPPRCAGDPRGAPPDVDRLPLHPHARYVRRVSDIVCILKDGRIISRAPSTRCWRAGRSR